MLHRVPGLMFEAVPEPDASAGGAEPVDAEPDAGGEPEPDDLAPAAAEPFDPQAYFETPEGRALLDQQVAARVPQPEPEPQEQQGFRPPPDPWESDNWAQEMAEWQAERDRAIIQAVTSAPGFQHAQEQHATEWTGSVFSNVEKEVGHALTDEVRDIASRAAVGSIPPSDDPAARNFDGAGTLAHNAKRLDALIQTERQAAVAEYKQQIQAASNGHQEPGVNGGGVNAETLPDGYEGWPSSKKLDYRFGRLTAANSERL